jgi:hypothetical protein
MEKYRTGLGSTGMSNTNQRDSTSINKPEVKIVSDEKSDLGPKRVDATLNTLGASPVNCLGKRK